MASGTMTSREAIDILRVINPPRENKRIFDEFIQARNMAIKALEKLAAIKSRTSPFDDWEYYADRLYDIAYQNGCEQGKKYAEQDKWIPCSVRLPKEKDAGILKKLGTDKRSDYVLATVKARGDRMTVVACTYDGKWDWNMKYAFPDYKVIAWRPLPAPYQEDEA